MVALTGPASLNALGASARQENQGRTADREPGAPTYRRIKTFLDSIPSIDTHQHLAAFDQLFCFVDTDQDRVEGIGETIYGATQGMRLGWAEAVAEKIVRGDLLRLQEFYLDRTRHLA